MEQPSSVLQLEEETKINQDDSQISPENRDLAGVMAELQKIVDDSQTPRNDEEEEEVNELNFEEQENGSNSDSLDKEKDLTEPAPQQVMNTSK